MTSAIIDITGEIFSTRSEVQGDRVQVHLIGCLDMETAPALQRFLGTLTLAARANRVRRFDFDTADLYLMSSSSISHLATWLKSLKTNFPACCVKFKTNPNLAWQRRTLDTIRRVAENIVSVE